MSDLLSAAIQKHEPVTAERHQLLYAGIEYFAKKGVESANLREIAASRGLTAAMVNYYFGSKSNFYTECLQVSVDVLNRFIEQETDGFDTPRGHIQALMQSVFNFNSSYPDLAMLVIRSSFSITPLPGENVGENAIFKTLNDIRDRLVAALQSAVDEGKLGLNARVPLDDLVIYILGQCEYIMLRDIQNKFFESHIPRPTPTVEHVLGFVDIVLDA